MLQLEKGTVLERESPPFLAVLLSHCCCHRLFLERTVGKRSAWLLWSLSLAITNPLFFFVGSGEAGARQTLLLEQERPPFLAVLLSSASARQPFVSHHLPTCVGRRGARSRWQTLQQQQQKTPAKNARAPTSPFGFARDDLAGSFATGDVVSCILVAGLNGMPMSAKFLSDSILADVRTQSRIRQQQHRKERRAGLSCS